MFCTTCAAAASPQDRFCRRCGGGLGDVDPPSPTPPPAPRIVAASRRPPTQGRSTLKAGLRVLSLLGVVPSLAGTWILLQEPTAMSVSASSPSVVTSASADASVAPSAQPSAEPSVVPSAEPSVVPVVVTCTSPFLGYHVTYPATLVTLDAPSRHACRYFDPKPFEAPRGSDLPPTQIRIYPSSDPFRSFDRRFDPETNADVLERRNLEIGGYRALRIELATHADDGDSTLYAYIVDVAGEVIVLDTYAAFDRDYEAAKADLDLVASQLEFPSGGVS